MLQDSSFDKLNLAHRGLEVLNGMLLCHAEDL